EIELGLDTSNDCEDGGLVELANQFFAQGDEWQQANEQILAHRDELSKTADASAELLGKLVSKEVQYSQLMWSNQHERAFEVAAALADSLSSDAFKPYRGFWYHEAATAAFLAWRTSGKEPYRTECLKKLDQAASSAQGLAWINQAKARVEGTKEAPPSDADFPERQWFANIEALLGRWNYDGPRFARELEAARKRLMSTDWKDVEIGIEVLGQMLGAQVYRWANPERGDHPRPGVSQGMLA